MKKYVVLILLQAPFLGWSQSNVSLDSCIDWAYGHYEYEKQAQAFHFIMHSTVNENQTKSHQPEELFLDVH